MYPKRIIIIATNGLLAFICFHAAGLESQFEKVQQDNFGVPYDLHSIMQYEEGDFAVSGKKSMESKANPGERLGAISHYDSLDVLKINRMYGCDKPLRKLSFLCTGGGGGGGGGGDGGWGGVGIKVTIQNMENFPKKIRF